jgi:hypothetical protein
MQRGLRFLAGYLLCGLQRSFHNRSLRESRRPTGPLIAAANRVSATSACNCAKIIFFGKRDLAFGINLPERSEIWKTFLGASDGPCSRQAACGHAHCARCTCTAAASSCPKSTHLSTHGLFAGKSYRRFLSRQGYRQAIGQEPRIASGEISRPPISILPSRRIS